MIFDEPLQTACPRFLEFLHWPEFIEDSDLTTGADSYLQQVEDNPFWDHPSLFVQPAGSKCGVHVDGWHSQFVQSLLCGRKRWVFWPFDEVDQIQWMGRIDDVSIEVQSSGSEGDAHFYQRRIFSQQSFPDLVEPSLVGKPADYPLGCSVANSHRVEIEVSAGDMILVPGGLPHQVFNLEDCIAVSRNFIDWRHAAKAAQALRWP